jgi:hypothetical protein
LVGKNGSLQHVLREKIELKAQQKKFQSERLLGQSSSQRCDEGKEQEI